MLVVDHTNGKHKQATGQAYPCNGGESATDTTKAVPNQDSHIRRVQARQRLTDGEQFHEGFVTEPRALCHEGVPQVGNDSSTETRRSNEEKFQKYLQGSS